MATLDNTGFDSNLWGWLTQIMGKNQLTSPPLQSMQQAPRPTFGRLQNLLEGLGGLEGLGSAPDFNPMSSMSTASRLKNKSLGIGKMLPKAMAANYSAYGMGGQSNPLSATGIGALNPLVAQILAKQLGL